MRSLAATTRAKVITLMLYCREIDCEIIDNDDEGDGCHDAVTSLCVRYEPSLYSDGSTVWTWGEWDKMNA